MRGKQSVKKGIWHIGGKYKRAPKRRQKGGAIPLGLLASIGAPILGEIAKPIRRKILGRGIKKWRTRRTRYSNGQKTYNLKKTSKSKNN